MKTPLILYPLDIKNIANSERLEWIIVDINTGRFFHNSHMTNYPDLRNQKYYSLLFSKSYYIYYKHTYLWKLTKGHSQRIPHQIFDLEPDLSKETEFIIPYFMDKFIEYIEPPKPPNHSFVLRDEDFFADYFEDIENFGETLIYLEYLDHPRITFDKSECFYGRHNEAYTKAYEIKSNNGLPLTYDHHLVEDLLEFLNKEPHTNTFDVSIVSVRIFCEVPIFLREHNKLMQKLELLDLHSVDYFYSHEH